MEAKEGKNKLLNFTAVVSVCVIVGWLEEPASATPSCCQRKLFRGYSYASTPHQGWSSCVPVVEEGGRVKVCSLKQCLTEPALLLVAKLIVRSIQHRSQQHPECLWDTLPAPYPPFPWGNAGITAWEHIRHCNTAPG